GNTPTREATEFRHFGQQTARGVIGHSRYRDQEILGLAPRRRTTDQVTDFIGELLQLTLKDFDVAGQALAHAHIAGTLLALTFGDQHLDDLTAPRHQFAEQTRGL